MMTLTFSKAKFTSELFFKRVEYAEVIFLTNKFEVNVFPQLFYSGVYYIDSIYEKKLGRTIYRTAFSHNQKDENVPLFPGINEYFISVNDNGGVVMIYNEDSKGIILKR